MVTEPTRRLPLDGLTIAVVGAGRIGSKLVRNLGLMGIDRIDVFERNHHVADPLRSCYTVYDGDFWDTLTLARLQDYDFAVCTVDGPIARQRMNQKCLVANTNLVQAWMEGTLAIVGAYAFAALPDSACFDCGSSRGVAATGAGRQDAQLLGSLGVRGACVPGDAEPAAAAQRRNRRPVGEILPRARADLALSRRPASGQVRADGNRWPDRLPRLRRVRIGAAPAVSRAAAGRHPGN